MTKINKLGKSTFLIAILSFLLVAVLAFGGTYAYFSDRSTAVTGDITTGHLSITSIEGTGETKALKAIGEIAQPNQVIFNNEVVTTKVTTNIAYFTRVRFNVKVETAQDSAHYANPYDDVRNATEHAAWECGDHVDNATDILLFDIVGGGSSASGSAWETASTEDVTNGQDIIYYQLAPTLAENTGVGSKWVAGSEGQPGTGTETFTFSIRVKDWVGNNGAKYEDETWDDEDTGDGVDDSFDHRADGCDYWMDAKITVEVIVEVLQADFLLDDNGLADPDADPADPAAVAFENGAQAAQKWEQALGKKQA